jgi:Xaa-Pro aminopeptidase
VYWPGGGGLRVEDCHYIGKDRTETLCGFPDDLRLLQEVET